MIPRSLFRHTVVKLTTHHMRKISHKIHRHVIQKHGQEQFSQFHTYSPLCEKLFMDKENQYAHNILQQINLYKLCEEPNFTHQGAPAAEEIEAILSPTLSKTPSDILNDFKKLALFCKETKTCLTEERFDNFIKVFINKCKHFSDEELKESLIYLSLFPETRGINSRNFVDVWSALDLACHSRITNWSKDELLLMCDYWYGLNLAKPSEFVWDSLRKIGRSIKKLSPQQLVQTMFLCNVIRKGVFDMIDFEVRLYSVIDQLSLKEIGIMSMGFFKTQTPIRNLELIKKFYLRLMSELDTVEDITLVNIMKVLRYSSKIPHTALMNELLEKICPEIERISLLSCLHVALLGTDIQQIHEKSVNLIVERFNKEIDYCRLKDMERITLVISQANMCEKNPIARELCEKIIIKLKDKVDEIIQYPKPFLQCLHFLTLCGYYDEELLSGALDEKFFKHAYKDNLTKAREMFQLDSFVRINLKGKYNGHQLNDKTRNRMGKILTNYFPDRQYRLSVTDQIVLEVKETCDDLYKTCYLKHVLPHFARADVVISYNKKENRALPLSKKCPDDYTGAILSRDLLLEEDLEDIATVVIVIAGWNNFMRGINTPTGLFKLKLDQLNILQHKVLVIPWFEWRSLETITDRHNYIQKVFLPLVQK